MCNGHDHDHEHDHGDEPLAIDESNFLFPYGSRLEAINIAAFQGSLAMVEATRRDTGERVAVLAVIRQGSEEGQVNISPVAVMLQPDHETDDLVPPGDEPNVLVL
jgi:hypothetical protein